MLNLQKFVNVFFGKSRLIVLLIIVIAVSAAGLTLADNENDKKQAGAVAAKETEKSADAKADLPEDQNAVELDQIVVTASRTAKSPHNEPSTIDIITQQDLDEKMSRTVPDALKYTPGIMIQKTAYGHGSPYIRGFTSFRNLFLIDGVRLNNSAFRPGPNQYWNTVDPFTIGRMEIIKGPGSVLYGSDAIGGTVNVLTVSPFDVATGPVGGRMYYRYDTAGDSSVGRLESYGVVPDGKSGEIGYMIGISGKNFNNLEGGRLVGNQPNTGYDEYDLDFKLEYRFDPDTWMTAYYQHVRQNNVPRTHKTVNGIDWSGLSVGSDLKRELDQERNLAYLQFHKINTPGFVNESHYTVSWHRQDEIRDRIKSSGSRDFQGFELGQLGMSAQYESNTPAGDFVYGLEWYRDYANSFSSTNSIQGPIADDAIYDMLGVFLQDTIPSPDEKFDLILGTRYTYAAADADKVMDPVSSNQTSIKDNWDSFVSSARLLWHVDDYDQLNMFTGVSQGFRAPNLSDLTRFDSAKTNEFEIPSTNLDPEKFTTYEVGTKYQNDEITGQLAYFYTDIKDRITRYPTGNVNADGENEVTKDNIGDGYVQGIELDASWKFHPQFTAFTAFTWLEGEASTYPTSAKILTDEPLDRIMPVTSLVGLRWDHPEKKIWIEGLANFVNRADKLSTRDAGDTSRIPPGGTPGYSILSFYSGWQMTKQTAFTFAVENITDEDYRIHGSGVNEAGINFMLGMEHKF